MRYYKDFWDEDRKDECAGWGTCTLWYEVGDDGYPTRQMVVYENGFVLQYGLGAVDEDDYGFLCYAFINPDDVPPEAKITEKEFLVAWLSAKPINLPSV